MLLFRKRIVLALSHNMHHNTPTSRLLVCDVASQRYTVCYILWLTGCCVQHLDPTVQTHWSQAIFQHVFWQAQEVLLDTAWTDEALAFEQWKAILGKDATVAFRGPRIKMAVVQDIPTSIGPHPDTGCAMYHGPMAGRSAPALLWHHAMFA